MNSKTVEQPAMGFTLIEILIVIVLIMIMAVLVIAGSRAYIVRANDVERATNAEAIAQKLELYYRTQPTADGSTYPPATTSYNDLVSDIGDTSIITAPDDTAQPITIAQTGWTPSQAGLGYLYVAQNVDGSLCSATPCVRYTLYFYNQIRGEYLSIASLRQQ